METKISVLWWVITIIRWSSLIVEWGIRYPAFFILTRYLYKGLINDSPYFFVVPTSNGRSYDGNYNDIIIHIYIVQPPSRSYQQKLGVSILGLLQKKLDFSWWMILQVPWHLLKGLRMGCLWHPLFNTHEFKLGKSGAGVVEVVAGVVAGKVASATSSIILCLCLLKMPPRGIPLYLVFCWYLVPLGISTPAMHILKSNSLPTTCSYIYI